MFVTDALISIIINFIAVALFLFSFFKSPRTKLDEVEEEPPEDKELGKFQKIIVAVKAFSKYNLVIVVLLFTASELILSYLFHFQSWNFNSGSGTLFTVSTIFAIIFALYVVAVLTIYTIAVSRYFRENKELMEKKYSYQFGSYRSETLLARCVLCVSLTQVFLESVFVLFLFEYPGP